MVEKFRMVDNESFKSKLGFPFEGTAKVVYDYQMEEFFNLRTRTVRTKRSMTSPHPWSKTFGVDFFQRAQYVSFNRLATVELTKELKHLKGLRQLEIHHGVNSAAAWADIASQSNLNLLEVESIASSQDQFGVPSLHRMRNLQEMQIRYLPLSLAEFKNIAKAKSLKTLRLLKVDLEKEVRMGSVEFLNLEVFDWSSWNQTPQTIPFVQHMPNLKEIHLDTNLKIDAQLFESLGQLAELESLTIVGTRKPFQNFLSLHNKAANGNRELDSFPNRFKPITRLQNLAYLTLESIELSNGDLQHIGKLDDLEYLSVSDTNVGNAGIDWLEGLTRLRTLKVGKTKITRAGLNRFKEKNPNCRIEWN